MSSQLRFCLLSLSGILAAGLGSSTLVDQERDIVVNMAANEAAARSQQKKFAYISSERSTRTGGHLWKEKVIEVDGDGVLRRLLEVDGHALNSSQSEAEDRRIKELAAHPDRLRSSGEDRKSDEVKEIRLLRLIPEAFLISPRGEHAGCKVFAFRPNPDFKPKTIEERVLYATEGTVSVSVPSMRMCSLGATIIEPVVFGYGLLGRINPGGHFVLDRSPIGATEWKTTKISVHVDGRLFMLKSVSKDQECSRTDIHLLGDHVSVEQAARLSQP